MFDCKIVYTIKSPKGQPDLETLVRLFFHTVSKPAVKFFNPPVYFRILLSTNDEIIIGSNHKDFEVRIYFLLHKEIPGEVFIIIIMNSFTWMGVLTSIYLRPCLQIIIRTLLRVVRKH